MGLAEVPVITLSGLSDTQKRALRIADNKIALNAGWDLEILQAELRELTSIEVDIDATLTDFSTGEIDVILSSIADPEDEVIQPVRAAPRTKPGDIWILGDHRVGSVTAAIPVSWHGSLVKIRGSMPLFSIRPITSK
jgi:ParB-like chromosome segregation protein Spo0J